MPFGLDVRALSGHVGIVGGIGGGKSNAMRHIGWQHMETDGALIQIDPHGTHEDSLHRTTIRRAVDTGLYKRQRVCIIDANSEWCTGLRLLAGTPVPSVMADHMIEAFERMQGDETLLEKPTLRRALHGLLAVLSELKLSLAEADLLLDPVDPHGLRAWALDKVRDRYAAKALMRLERLANEPRLMKEFEVETIGTENRLAPLLSSPAMRAIVGCQMLDMVDVLDAGAKVFINTGGHDAASEAAGDLLGKLVLRAVLFAAKRRRTATPALVIADECARYVSQDCERALAELRKYRVGLILGFQTFAMLGKPGDPVREAIEKIPATRMVFRLNSMEEATALAPEVMELNLEMPVEVLRAPAVVGYEVRRLQSASQGSALTHTRQAATTQTEGTGTTDTIGEATGDSYTYGTNQARSHTRSATNSLGRNYGAQYSQGKSSSQAEMKGESHSETDSRSETVGSNYSRSRSEGESSGEVTSDTHSHSHTRGGGRSNQTSASRGSNFAQGFEVDVDIWRSGEQQYRRAVGWPGDAKSRNVQAGYNESTSQGTAAAENWSESDATSTGRSTQQSWSTSVSEAVGESEARSRGQAVQRGRSRSTADTVGTSETTGISFGTSEQQAEGEADTESYGSSQAWGTHKDRSRSHARSVQKSIGQMKGEAQANGTTLSRGWSETLAPILEVRPTSVHSLPNVTYMAARTLCTLPTGVAVVRTIRGNRVDAAVVLMPERRSPPVTDQQYAADLSLLVPRSEVGLPMRNAERAIEQRQSELIEEAQLCRLPPPEPASAAEFRVPIKKVTKPKSKKGTKDD
ncbi:DUF87 domain-containing protein [Bradyrhizobium sediminis]|uniref:DUF87 domain-containing protein n=1 Tax=Bradyrhizobium sediminis TaxID=2840469 RepID=A0A975NFQ1_9BRAD|nr:DUF87 domain-containing protein [Bradyrhizobium sediminis]QWG14283.1 DUF87 domain-containing protein [Bradyrhizobium sediminis]